ncbi:unnamed protein product, partial [Gulo gulo]
MFYRLENGSSRRLSSVCETPFSPFISPSVDGQKDVDRGTDGCEASGCCPSGTDTIPASALLPPGSCLWVRPPGWVSLAPSCLGLPPSFPLAPSSSFKDLLP